MADRVAPGDSVGERVAILPNHACIVSNLHKVYAACQGRVEAVWTVAARAVTRRDGSARRVATARPERYAQATPAMTSTVTLPAWLLVLIAMLALWAASERLLLPSALDRAAA
jgi:hypothetical protein